MTNTQTTIVVAAGCGLSALSAFAWWIVVPAWTSYSRPWERVAATFLTLYVLAAFIGLGVAGGLAVVWFWDRISP
jgi:hypothetical protein